MPSPLCIGTVELEDGTTVKGFLCEAQGLAGAADITEHGGWRAFLGGANVGDGGGGMTTIPIVDVSPLALGDEAGTQRVAAEIGAACRETGFFYVAGHPVPPSLIEDAFAASADFFARPDGEKRAVLYTAEGNRGYVPMKGEALDPGKPADLKEAFNIGLELPDDDPELWRAGCFARAISGRTWRASATPCSPISPRATISAASLHRAFAADLGLTPGFFEDKLDRPMAVLRLLHYPAAPARI